MKNKFGFILVKPQLGENIGACARSMKNFGFQKLYIINPKINFPNHKAKAMSVGAYDIINKTKVFKETNKAIKILFMRIHLFGIREKRQQLLMSAGALLVSMSACAHDNFNEAYQSFDIDAIKADVKTLSCA